MLNPLTFLGSPAPPRDLRQVIQDLVTAEDTATVRRVLADHPGLLHSSLDSCLTRYLRKAWKQGDKIGTRDLLACRAFLARCQNQDIDAVLAETSALPLASSSPLGQLLELTYERTDLPRRAKLARQVLADVRRTSEPELWAALQRELADCLSRSEGSDRAERLEEALDAYQATLEVRGKPPYVGSPLWAQTLHAMAATLRRRVKGNRADNLKQALQLYQEALTVRTKKAYPAEWAETQHDLGATWLEMPVGDRAENVQKGIEYYKAALTVRTRQTMPDLWAVTTHDLAIAYTEHPVGDRAQNLEESIKLCRAVQEIWSPDEAPLDWGRSQVALSNAYVLRLQGGRAENLEQAIDGYKKALRVLSRKAYPADWARVHYNLANAYWFYPADRVDNLDRAIEHFQQALKVYTPKAYPMEWAHVQTGLGNIFCQPEVGQRANSLEQAIACYRAALTVRTRKNDSTGWATIQNNLGNAYADRIQGKRVDNQEQAIACYELALLERTRKKAPAGWAETMNNLGTVYIERLRGNPTQNREEAIRCLRQALKVHKPLVFPNDSRRAARNLGHLLFAEGRWSEAHAAYATALQAAEILYKATFMETGREAEIGENAALYIHDAFCLAQLGQFEEALMRLEEGKTRTLAERLGRSAVQLQKAEPEDQEAYLNLLNRLKALEAEQQRGSDSRLLAEARRPYTEMIRDVELARQELNALIRRINDYLPDFLPGPLDFAAIQTLVPGGQAALVEFCVTEKGCVVLVMRPEGKPEPVWIEGFTQSDLNHIIRDWVKAYQSQDSLHWQATIERVLNQIGLRLVTPLHTMLQKYGISRLILIPQSSLFLLPLHAAPLDGNGICLMDCYEISYAPSATILRRCRERAERAQGQGLFAVTNPTGDIAYAGSELQTIRPLFGGHHVILPQGKATKQATLQEASGHAYAYFSCHGQYNWDDPLRSSLRLAGSLTRKEEQHLTLAEIEEKLDLSHTRLVTLSACETGLSEAIGPRAEEYIGLPAGFLLAGAPAVVAPLWAVYEISTALLMERFYMNHICGDPDEDLETRSPLPAAEALRRAQIWLRDQVTVKEVTSRCKARIEELKSNKRLVPPWLLQHCRTYAQMARRAPDSRPFSHPFYWAAFTLSGATRNLDGAREEGDYARCHNSS
jgi:CHAT domain-containing protein